MRSLTIVIPTFQRREPLRRLLIKLGEQLAAGQGIDIVVIIDGSTDGSEEMIETLELAIPVTSTWQANRGLAAARNTGLALAEGELVLFLDDDMIPSEGLVSRHRSAHARAGERVVMGPCLIPSHARTVEWNRAWARRFYDQLPERLQRPEQFSAANTSGPTAVFRSVGGFDERFVGWGYEDFEFGARLLAAGVEIVFDKDAVASHEQERSVWQLCQTKLWEGRNVVQFAELHPEAAQALLRPIGGPRRRAALRSLARLPAALRRPATTMLCLAAIGEAAVTRGGRDRLLHFAMNAFVIAGVVERDETGDLTALLTGA